MVNYDGELQTVDGVETTNRATRFFKSTDEKPTVGVGNGTLYSAAATLTVEAEA